jgi:putative spermidine/putrescine transport system permease protein
VTAASTRRRGLPQGARTLLLLAPALLVVLVLFVGGVALGVLQSLGYQPFLGARDLSLDAYRGLVDDVEVRRSLVLTFRLALLATTVSAVLAVAAALLLRSTRRGRKAATLLFSLNLPVPHLVGAAAMLLLLGQSGLLSRVLAAVGLVDVPADAPALTNDAFGWAILAEYVWKETPFIGVVVLAALSGGVADLEGAARTLGAGAWQRFRFVVLPLITPAVVSTSVIVFAFTFGSYEVPLLLGQPFPATLPVVAYQAYSDTDLTTRPRAMAIAVVIAVLVTLVVLAYTTLTERVLRPAERRRVTGTG